LRNGGKGREKPPLASRRGRPGHRGSVAPTRPRCLPLVHRRPPAILRPGVLGLTVNRAPPFAPPCCHPLATTRHFGRAIPVLSTYCQEEAMGVRRRPGKASGAAADPPLPRAPSGDPTPITPSVEEFLSRLRLGTFWIDTYSAYRRSLTGGPLGKRFFGLKCTETSSDRDQIWTTGRGHEAHRF